MRETEENKCTKAEKIISLIIVIFMLSLMAFLFTLIIIYGNKPYDEIPEWVAWIIFRNRR